MKSTTTQYRGRGLQLSGFHAVEWVGEWSLPARLGARGPPGRELSHSGGGERRGTSRRGSRQPRLRLGRRRLRRLKIGATTVRRSEGVERSPGSMLSLLTERKPDSF